MDNNLFKYLGGHTANVNLTNNLSDSSEAPCGNRSHKAPLPRQDCDKWDHYNSFFFSFTAITTIGIFVYSLINIPYITSVYNYVNFGILLIPILFVLKAMATSIHGQKTVEFCVYFILFLECQLMEYLSQPWPPTLAERLV